MEEQELKEKIEQIAGIVVGMKCYEWRQISHAIEQKFSQASSRTVLTDAQEIKRAIHVELFGLCNDLNA